MRIKRDYERKQFINPHFDHSGRGETARKFDTAKYLKILALVFFIYLLTYSDLFKIEKVTITGLDMIPEQEITDLVTDQKSRWRWFVLPQKSSLWFNQGALRQKMEANYKLNRLDINMGWRSLKIDIEERVAYIIIYNQEKFYFADEQGTITKELAGESIRDYWERFPIINVGAQTINIGDNVVNGSVVSYLLELNQVLSETKSIRVQGYELKGIDAITMVSKDGWRVHFATDSDVKQSVDNLLLVLKEKITNPATLQYIDLRFGDRVFYQ